MDPFDKHVLYLHNCHESSLSAEIQNAIIEKRGKKEVIFLIEDTTNPIPELSGIIQQMNVEQIFIKIYRDQKLGESSLKTFLSAEERLSAVQLCLAQWNKQENDEFDADVSKVLWISRKLEHEKLKKAIQPPSSPSTTLKSPPPDSLPNTCKTPKSSNTNSSSFRTPKTPYFGDDSPQVIESVLSLYNSFLKQCGKVDSIDILQRVKEHFDSKEDEKELWRSGNVLVIVDLPQEKTKIEMLKVLLGERSVFCICPSSSLPTGFNSDVWKASHAGSHMVCANEMDLSELQSIHSAVNRTPNPHHTQPSASETFCRRLFFSYIALLVNTRDELALARCLCLPDRGLGQDGFCALRKAASQKGMPMFQTAVSYVMQIRLGGRSYAPDPSSPLANHVKALSEFVNIMQRLQTVVEETGDTSHAVERVITALKITLIKTKDCVLRKSSLQVVASQILMEVRNIQNRARKNSVLVSPKEVGNGGSMLGQGVIKVFHLLLDVESTKAFSGYKPTDVLLDQFSSQSTPVRFPSMLSQFRSPEVTVFPPHEVTLQERLMPKKKKYPQGSKSCMDWAVPAVSIVNEFQPPKPSPEPTKEDIFERVSTEKFRLWATSPEDRTFARKMFKLRQITNEPCTPVSEMIDKEDSLKHQGGCTPRGRKSVTSRASEEGKENVSDKETSQSVPKNKNLKRKKLQLGNGNERKKAKSDKSAKKKNKPLLKGQKTLSSFFRV